MEREHSCAWTDLTFIQELCFLSRCGGCVSFHQHISLLFFCSFCFFETETHYIAQVGHELNILMFQVPECQVWKVNISNISNVHKHNVCFLDASIFNWFENIQQLIWSEKKRGLIATWASWCSRKQILRQNGHYIR
jgi:hypothetical protein